MNEFKNTPSIIPSMDVGLTEMKKILWDIRDLKSEIGGIKIGSLLVWKYGLDRIVKEIRTICDFPIIFDAQKGGTDIPSITEEQVKLVAESGIDAYIACPPGSGTKTLESFVNTSFECNIIPIVLLEMTHPMANTFLKDNAGEDILNASLDLGVKYYVAPGNNPEKILKYKTLAKEKGKFIEIFSPGLGFQGGNPSDAVKAGTNFFIIGRSIYNSRKPRDEVINIYKSITDF